MKILSYLSVDASNYLVSDLLIPIFFKKKITCHRKAEPKKGNYFYLPFIVILFWQELSTHSRLSKERKWSTNKSWNWWSTLFLQKWFNFVPVLRSLNVSSCNFLGKMKSIYLAGVGGVMIYQFLRRVTSLFIVWRVCCCQVFNFFFPTNGTTNRLTET